MEHLKRLQELVFHELVLHWNRDVGGLWSQECQEAFNGLKAGITSPPTLA